ncbi:MAG: S1 RNA-binding domain-containing protein [bacterium]|nr:S1 RNA-binding domain-containing protein [bacterium]
MSEANVNEENLTMADFEDAINKSFSRIKEGDLVTCTVIDVKEDRAIVDIGSYAEGVIYTSELSDDPHFSIFTDLTVGESFKAYVLEVDDGNGNVLLSKKQASSELAWEEFNAALEDQRRYSVVVDTAVNAGVVAYVNGVRGFIPASQLSLSYVENLEEWVGKKLEVIVITADKDRKKLVLSAKAVAREEADAEHREKLSHLEKGIVTTGVVERIEPYGAFVNIGDGLTGLVHISRMCAKRIKSPKEVVSEGQEVKVKIVDVVDGKISLDMKAVSEGEDVVEDIDHAPVEYISDDDASTSLGSLLSKFKL